MSPVILPSALSREIPFQDVDILKYVGNAAKDVFNTYIRRIVTLDVSFDTADNVIDVILQTIRHGVPEWIVVHARYSASWIHFPSAPSVYYPDMGPVTSGLTCVFRRLHEDSYEYTLVHCMPTKLWVDTGFNAAIASGSKDHLTAFTGDFNQIVRDYHAR